MYDKTDGKQVNHFIIGTEDEGISVAQLYYIAEVAADYFFSQGIMARSLVPTCSMGCSAFMRRIALNWG